MGRGGDSHVGGARPWLALASMVLVSCTRHSDPAVDGVVVLDEVLQLARGEKRDAARRELRVDGAATFVAFVDEEDCDVTLRLDTPGGATSIEVNNTMFGESLEVAVLEVPRGAPLVLTLDSAPDYDQPCRARTKLLRYDEALRQDPRVAARLAALQGWAGATRTGRTVEDTRSHRLGQLEQALAHLESADGDPGLAAWARLVRADMNYLDGIDYPSALADARAAWLGFEKAADARNAARGRYVHAAVLAEIAVDTSAVNPSAEEADRLARDLFTELATDPALSAVQRARAVNFLGSHASTTNQWIEAEKRFREALRSFEQLGDRRDQLMVLNNLGVLYAELGDFQAATAYFDRIVARIDQVGSLRDRVLYLH